MMEPSQQDKENGVGKHNGVFSVIKNDVISLVGKYT